MLSLPRTSFGRWSLWMLGGSLLALLALFFFVNMGVKGGETLLDLPLDAWIFLMTPMLLSLILAIGGGAATVVAFIRDRERALLVLLPLAWALVVLSFAAGEFVNPH